MAERKTSSCGKVWSSFHASDAKEPSMIVKSASPDVSVPDVSITDFVLRQASRLGDKPALIDGPSGRTISYRQLADSVKKVAAGLAKRGFKKGDVFAIYSPNVPEYAVIFLAVASVGGINTTANPLYTADELAKQLADSRARFLVTVAPFLDKAQEAAKKSAVEEIFVFGSADGATSRAHQPERGSGRPAVLERNHRTAQGRHVDAPQPRGESVPVQRHAQLGRLRR